MEKYVQDTLENNGLEVNIEAKFISADVCRIRL